MRLFGAVLMGAALASAPVLVAGPALAQGNDVLGQVQRFFNGPSNDNGYQNNQDAYQRGRLDEQRRQEEAQRERWREQHAQSYDRYPEQRGYYSPGPADAGQYYNRGPADGGHYYNGPAYDPDRR